MQLYITVIAEMSVNIIKKCIFFCKLWNCHSHKYTNGDDDQSRGYCKKIFIQQLENLTCPEVLEADRGKCVSCKPKTEKWVYNEGSKILKTLLSQLMPKTSEADGAEVERAATCTLSGVHAAFGFNTYILPRSPALLHRCLKKHKEKLVSL